jgi:hypothetical protein
MLRARHEGLYDEVLVEEIIADGGSVRPTPLHMNKHNKTGSIMNQIHTSAAEKKIRNLSSSAAGYSPPGENLLPRNHVIGSRARYEMQMLDSSYQNRTRTRDDSSLFSTLFGRTRRPSDKHKEFVDMLQFPKGNK